MVSDLLPFTKASKAKALSKNERYYYIFFLGTSSEDRGRGYCSQLVRHYHEIAGKLGLPIWWEAGAEHCWKLYKRLGFVTVDEIMVAKGKAGADGNAQVGGEGVRIWGMIWRPECANAGN